MSTLQTLALERSNKKNNKTLNNTVCDGPEVTELKSLTVSQEEPGLVLAEKILARAERTRNKFLPKEAGQIEAAGKRQQLELSGDTPHTAYTGDTTTNNTISQKQLTSLLQHTNPPHGKRDVQGKPTPHSRTLGKKGHVKPASTGSTSTTSYTRPSSRVQFKPAHATAPFKTDTERRGRVSVIQVKSAAKTPPSSVKVPLGSTISQQSSHFSSSQNDAVERTKSGKVQWSTKHGTTEKNTLTPVTCVDTQSLCEGSGTSRASVDDLLSGINNLNVDNSNKPDTQTITDNNTATSGHSGGERFSLLKDGKKLSLPAKYNRLMAQNRRLRHRLDVVTRTTGPGDYSNKHTLSTEAANYFTRIQHHSERDRRTENIKLGHVITLTNTYLALQHILVAVHDVMLYTGVDSMEWDEVLSCKHKLDTVLDGFHSLEEEYNAVIGNSDHTTNVCVTPSAPEAVCPMYWLPPYIGSVGCSVRCVRYCKRRQIVEYTALVHDLQRVLLHRHILQHIEDILQDLQQATGQERWFVSMFRGLYSMVNSLGTTFPTLVADTIDDNDQSWENNF